MNYFESTHYKFGLIVGFINIFTTICMVVFEWRMGVLNPNFSGGAGLAAGSICLLILIILGLLNTIFNIVLYSLNNEEIDWTNFPRNFKDFIYI